MKKIKEKLADILYFIMVRFIKRFALCIDNDYDAVELSFNFWGHVRRVLFTINNNQSESIDSMLLRNQINFNNDSRYIN